METSEVNKSQLTPLVIAQMMDVIALSTQPIYWKHFQLLKKFLQPKNKKVIFKIYFYSFIIWFLKNLFTKCMKCVGWVDVGSYGRWILSILYILINQTSWSIHIIINFILARHVFSAIIFFNNLHMTYLLPDNTIILEFA